jgi:hypothetical protein
MIPKRRNRGFERAGSFAPEELGLPARRGRELKLALAWAGVAGEPFSLGRSEVRIRRGVLEVEAERSAGPEMMPRLARRLVESDPELGIRRWRLLLNGEVRAEGRIAQKE